MLKDGEPVFSTDNDMVKGYKNMKAPSKKNENTPSEPIPGHERYPHPAKGSDIPEPEEAETTEAIQTPTGPESTGPEGTGPEGTGVLEEDSNEGSDGPTDEKETVSVQQVQVKTVKSLRR